MKRTYLILLSLLAGAAARASGPAAGSVPTLSPVTSVNATDLFLDEQVNGSSSTGWSAGAMSGAQMQAFVLSGASGFQSESLSAASSATLAKPGGQKVSIDQITLSAGSGAYAVARALSDANAAAGDVWFVNIIWPTSTNPTVTITDAGSSATLDTLAGTAQGGYSTLQFTYTGTAWVALKKGELDTRNLGPGVATALANAPGAANGFFQFNGSGNFPSWTEDPSGTATFSSGSTLTMASGSTFNLSGSLVANLQQLYASMSSNAARTLATGQIAIDSDGLLAGGDFFWRYGVTGTPAGGQVLSVANLGQAPTITIPTSSTGFQPALQNYGTSPITSAGMSSYNDTASSPPAFFGTGSATLTAETGTGPVVTTDSGGATFGSGPVTTTLTTNANGFNLQSGPVNDVSGEVTAPSAWAGSVFAGSVNLDTGGVNVGGTFSRSGTVLVGTTGAAAVNIGGASVPIEIGNVYPIVSLSTATGATTMAVSSSYLSNSSSSIAFTLPATIPVGKMVQVIGMGSGGWTIAQASGQQILYNGSSTTSGTSGYLSGGQGASVTLMCTTANTTFIPVASAGTLTTH